MPEVLCCLREQLHARLQPHSATRLPTAAALSEFVLGKKPFIKPSKVKPLQLLQMLQITCEHLLLDARGRRTFVGQTSVVSQEVCEPCPVAL